MAIGEMGGGWSGTREGEVSGILKEGSVEVVMEREGWWLHFAVNGRRERRWRRENAEGDCIQFRF